MRENLPEIFVESTTENALFVHKGSLDFVSYGILCCRGIVSSLGTN